MKSRAARFIILSLVMAAGAGGLLGKTRELAAPGFRIAVPDGVGGLAVHHALQGGDFHGAGALPASEYALKDCCAAVSEWAFSADEADMAVMCPDAAARLMEKDPRSEILGPCVVNSDVIILRPGVVPGRIGIARKRPYQKRLVVERFGPGCSVVAMPPSALPYAYEKGTVDGIVMDVLKGAFLVGERVSAGGGADVVTYVLVVKKSFKNRPPFMAFMKAYRRAVEELGDMAVLTRAAAGCKGVTWTDKEMGTWKDLRVRFVFPEKRD